MQISIKKFNEEFLWTYLRSSNFKAFSLFHYQIVNIFVNRISKLVKTLQKLIRFNLSLNCSSISSWFYEISEIGFLEIPFIIDEAFWLVFVAL
jgi:hypothetical protein